MMALGSYRVATNPPRQTGAIGTDLRSSCPCPRVLPFRSRLLAVAGPARHDPVAEQVAHPVPSAGGGRSPAAQGAEDQHW